MGMVASLCGRFLVMDCRPFGGTSGQVFSMYGRKCSPSAVFLSFQLQHSVDRTCANSLISIAHSLVLLQFNTLVSPLTAQ